MAIQCQCVFRRVKGGYRFATPVISVTPYAATAFEGEFSNVSRSYAGEGVARYSW
jgi:hypothetical protein